VKSVLDRQYTYFTSSPRCIPRFGSPPPGDHRKERSPDIMFHQYLPASVRISRYKIGSVGTEVVFLGGGPLFLSSIFLSTSCRFPLIDLSSPPRLEGLSVSQLPAPSLSLNNPIVLLLAIPSSHQRPLPPPRARVNMESPLSIIHPCFCSLYSAPPFLIPFVGSSPANHRPAPRPRRRDALAEVVRGGYRAPPFTVRPIPLDSSTYWS